MVGRDPEKLKSAVADVKRIVRNEKIEAYTLDLSCGRSIAEFADSIKYPVHVLINNASTTPRTRIESGEGIEIQWSVNVLAYFRMTNAFKQHLSAAGRARIVNVASGYAGNLDLSDPEFKRRKYDNNTAYRQSKQANRMLTKSFADILADKNIIVNACHPGEVNSKLSNDLGFGGHESPEAGADTPVWLALSDETASVTGRYFEYRRMANCSFMQDTDKVKRLYELCGEYE
jgi:NAD(P)-dependent dehydrogenase (short-subunit alcohol dehydrogenase family)